MEKKVYDMKCIYLEVRRADRMLTQIYDSFIKKTGLRSTQYSLLRCISNLHEPYISEIGKALSMDQTTVSRNVAKLEQYGLIETGSSPDAPHKTFIRITGLGYKKLEMARIGWEKAQSFVKSRLGEDFERLSNLLNKLTTVLEYKV